MAVNSECRDDGTFWDAAIKKAVAWRKQHGDHVRKLESTAKYAYPPSGSDVIHPELWKDGHWRWLKEIVNA